MLEVTEVEIKKRLAFDNPWWKSGATDSRIAEWPRRAYFPGFMRLLTEVSVNRAIVLMGPRRVGKTVMLTQAIQNLIDGGTKPDHIFYVSVDTPTYTGIALERLLTWFMEIHGHKRGDRLFVFFDEIQYHPDWERHLKSLVDSFPAMRFVASGSAAAALKLRSTESGAGRFTDSLLPPLNFAEFLRFRNVDGELVVLENGRPSILNLTGLNEAFVDYINFGGFPEAVLDPRVREQMDRYVANDIVDKVLLRDIPSLYGIQDSQELKRFFTVLAYNTGSEVTLEALSQASGVAKNTLRKYLDYLEAAFLIHRLHRLDQNAQRFKRVTHFKVYLTNPSIRSALFGPVVADDPAMGRLTETAVFSQLAQSALAQGLFYARWKDGEVDIVSRGTWGKRPVTAVEIKWSDRAVTRPREELTGLLSFCARLGLTNAWVYTRTTQTQLNVDGVALAFNPVSMFCYMAAVRGIEEPLRDLLDPRTMQPLGS